MPKLKKILLAILGLVLVIVIAVAVYMCIPCKASDEAKSKITNPKDTIKTEYSDTEIVCQPKNTQASVGLVFYPGARIESFAYGGLYEGLADHNIMTVAIDAPLHFAFWSADNFDSIVDRFPNINKWYFGGHSLGGEVADQRSLKYQDKIAGVINLGAHPRQNMSQCNFSLLNLYASNDNISKPDDYSQYLDNLPQKHQCHIIDGGCHSYFGDYGFSLFDGQPTISQSTQNQETVEWVVGVMGEGSH